MTPALAKAIAELARVKAEEGSSLNRHAPKIAAAIELVLREAKRGSR